MEENIKIEECNPRTLINRMGKLLNAMSGAAARTGTGKKEKINEYGKKKVWKFG